MFGKRRRRVNLAVVSSMVSVLVMAWVPAAWAHHPEIEASSSCRDGKPVIEFTSSSWSSEADVAGRYNSGIDIFVDPEVGDLIGGSAVKVGSGMYLPGSPDVYTDPEFLASLYTGPGFDPTAEPGYGTTQAPAAQFSGVVDASQWAGKTVEVFAQTTRRWWSVAEPGSIEMTTVEIPADCVPSNPPTTVPPPPTPPPSTGRIIVAKETTPDGSAEPFEFTASWTTAGFALSDGGRQASTELSPGTYSVSEQLPSGWSQQSAVCSDGSPVSAISLQESETVTCTFVNAIVEVAGIQVAPTTTIPAVVAETLPFTGFSAGGIALLGLGSMLVGGLVLSGARRSGSRASD